VQIVFVVLCLIVALELLIHMIYHWKTGKAGLYDPPFSYLKDIWRYLFNETSFQRKN